MKKIKDTFYSIAINFKTMPFFLKYITLGSIIGGPLFIIGPFLPSFYFAINGQQVTQSEFWSAGAGPTMVIVGIVLLICGIGFIYRKPWSRWIFCLGILLPVIIDAISGSILEKTVANYIYTIGVTAVIYIWYFFIKKSVRNYFGLKALS